MVIGLFNSDVAKIAITDRVQHLLNSSDKTYSLKDKLFKLKNQKGKLNIHYPVLCSDEKNMTLINSSALAKLTDLYSYDGDMLKENLKLNCEVKTSKKDYISIIFYGDKSGLESDSRIYNTNFTMNFDLKHFKAVYLMK